MILRETAAQENETSYFPLLDRIGQGSFAHAKTDRELYEKFLEVLKEDELITNPEALSTFKLALSLRSAVPRIEAHYQYYSTAVEPSLPEDQEGCQQWYLFDGKQYCGRITDVEKGAVKDNSYDIVSLRILSCVSKCDVGKNGRWPLIDHSVLVPEKLFYTPTLPPQHSPNTTTGREKWRRGAKGRIE